MLHIQSFFFFFVHAIDHTQYITQIVQIQTQHAHGHDRRDNKLIFCLLPHSHDIGLYVLKQEMLLDGIVFWSMVLSAVLETTNKIMIHIQSTYCINSKLCLMRIVRCIHHVHNSVL